ncbi:uncharacterized protein L969DRAFT_44482 [Mixia osmundae IAM 14324]|uniref:Prokaryotic-type class I peptide chain release factors domain-containing protein n=1 Tax=Mixia osmundae (strain CBS 9802 / IAM 14324 / JCM 22182 / KY 12970) TaxID=764103 RepID=G7E0A6_MIXOS|nr:uncharacterized protein L969DRAFT_44482 [Mixia osmundae IAM 14324]KEI42257.1 hypothetical protein L969DRAFT_44482 [Mixia osmundae IAM 14324]GAA96266.1 hypothetical protein E5Q_02931 [Mixia osmundae IAM 14324]
MLKLLRCTCWLRAPDVLLIRCSRSSSSLAALSEEHRLIIRAAEATLSAAKQETNDIERAKAIKATESLSDALARLHTQQSTLHSLIEMARGDPDETMRELAELDVQAEQAKMDSQISRVKDLVLPRDEIDHSGALVEVKAAVGGNEAGLFAGDLLRMYARFGLRHQWPTTMVESTTLQGLDEAYREAILEVRGQGAYGVLRNEAGVHRVQRVPSTDSAGRVHTSTVAVIVLPLVEEGSSSLDNILDEKDVRMEVTRSRGAGGQHVNKTESAVKLTHLPTGITVSMQEDRSQHKNRSKAFRVLRAKLLDRQILLDQEQRRSVRRGQVKSSDRSEKVRTYNFAQSRVTDHRIPLTLPALDDILEGGEMLDHLSARLRELDELEKLASIVEDAGA